MGVFYSFRLSLRGLEFSGRASFFAFGTVDDETKGQGVDELSQAGHAGLAYLFTCRIFYVVF